MIPGWTIGLLGRAVLAIWRHRRDRRRRREALRRIRQEVPDMKGLVGMLEWLFKVKAFEKYRRKIGLGAVIAGALIEGLNAGLAALGAHGIVPGFAVSLAPKLQAIGGYIALVGAAYKDDYPKPK